MSGGVKGHLTFNLLAGHYERHYLKPAEYVNGQKVSGPASSSTKGLSSVLRRGFIRDFDELQKPLLLFEYCLSLPKENATQSGILRLSINKGTQEDEQRVNAGGAPKEIKA